MNTLSTPLIFKEIVALYYPASGNFKCTDPAPSASRSFTEKTHFINIDLQGD